MQMKNLFYRLEQANRVREVEARRSKLEAASNIVAHAHVQLVLAQPEKRESEAAPVSAEPAPQPPPRAPTIDFKSAIDGLQELVQAVFSGNTQEQYDATVSFRKALSIERRPPIDDDIRAGLVPMFVEFLSRDEMPKLQVS